MSSSHCLENPPTLNPNYGKGKVEEFGGLKTYITGTSDSNRAIILASDAFGYQAPKLRKLADKVAAAGYLVLVPDFFHGDAADPNNLPLDPDTWIKNHDPAKGCEDCKAVIAQLKGRGISAIGAVGFCWGGMMVVKVASSDDIKAAVILHPGPITEEEIKAVKVPTAILGAEYDRIFSAQQLKQLEQILAAKSEIESYVKIFPGVVHGWTVRYNDEDDKAVKIAEEAHSDMLNWLIKYVK